MAQTIAQYLAENIRFISDESAAAISELTDADWPAILVGVDELNAGGAEPGIDCAVTITTETLADFDGARATSWSESGARHELNCDGRPALHFERFQLQRGMQRRSMVVIDLGDRRVALY